jgi:DnaJ-class molecular chaperone
MERNFYDVMMISPAADRQLITVVYRHLAKRYHPDMDPSPRARARMTELNEAYATLSDRTRRAIYDEQLGFRPASAVAPPEREDAPAGDVAAGVFEQGFGEAGPPPASPAATGRGLTFGRYRGWTLNQIARYDRDYLEWLSRTTMGRNYRQELAELLRVRP